MVLATPNPDDGGENLAFSLQAAYPNDVWNANLVAMEVQPNHAPAVGFVRRRGFRGYQPSLSFSPRPNQHSLIRQFTFGADMALFTDLENRTLTREIGLTLLRVQTHAGDNISFNARPTFERLDRDFEISDGVILPEDSEYDFTRYTAGFGTANRRFVAVNGSYTWGSFFSGKRRDAELGVALRPMPGITINTSAERNQIELQQGKFTTHVFRFVSDTQFNPRIYVVNNLQYDSVSEQLGWQSRLRWIVRPGNDLYLVYTHNWFEHPDSDAFGTLDRRAAAKINYTRRL
jgi:hypothetical protein